MNNDSEKIAKIWKNAAWFLLSLSLLVSSVLLILIFEIWDPELLRSLKGFIPDKPIHKHIIVITTLLASVSLLSFLIQIYMNKDPEKVAKIWKIVAYPVHWAFRLAARFLLLFGILAAILMPFLILILILIILVILTLVSLILLGIWNIELLKSLNAFISNEHITIITLEVRPKS